MLRRLKLKRFIIVEGDSLNVISWLKGGVPPPLRFDAMFDEIDDLIAGSFIDINHLQRSANGEADSLARGGLFFSYFKELVGKEVTVELKNDLAIRGILHSVDQYLNIKLENTRVVDQDKYPHMMSVRNCFIRGSVVRYVQLPPDGVDTDILHDATRREARGG
ncbi:sm-like protein LSM2 isoform X1 [Tasmannia lanceolata]|uniref:sm-like protein LSM2 isoform X1 n=1 Tax=Tasmannia lanceolata TaxID=3420 RepID=UPI004063CE20